MPIRQYKAHIARAPVSTVQTFDDITSTTSHKPLTEPLKRTGGRNNRGEITSWWRGGGHKRNTASSTSSGTRGISPRRSPRVGVRPEPLGADCALTYADGEKRYILHPLGLKSVTPWSPATTSTSSRATACAEEHPARHDDSPTSS